VSVPHREEPARLTASAEARHRPACLKPGSDALLAFNETDAELLLLCMKGAVPLHCRALLLAGESGSGEEGSERDGAGNGFGPDISQSGPMKPVVHTHR